MDTTKELWKDWTDSHSFAVSLLLYPQKEDENGRLLFDSVPNPEFLGFPVVISVLESQLTTGIDGWAILNGFSTHRIKRIILEPKSPNHHPKVPEPAAMWIGLKPCREREL